MSSEDKFIIFYNKAVLESEKIWIYHLINLNWTL